MSFGSKLKRLRRQLRPKVNQQELSEATGVPVGTIRNWEQGRRGHRPDLVALKKLADHFKVTVDYLLEVEPGEPADDPPKRGRPKKSTS